MNSKISFKKLPDQKRLTSKLISEQVTDRGPELFKFEGFTNLNQQRKQIESNKQEEHQ